MKTVLIAGAGKSSTFVIDYMLQNAKNLWRVIVMDSNPEAVAEKISGHPKGEAAIINIDDDEKRKELVSKADIVISLMPPHLHILLAKDCLEFGKNLITSSYMTDEMKALHDEAVKKGLIFMCELGLDPGIDHMSACKLIHSIRKISGEITSFKSYCGGLIAPENDDNPWKYKISWNPRNIINAAKSGAVWLENGKTVELDYKEIYDNFKKTKVNNEYNSLAYYPNRDSLKYIEMYDLSGIKTFMRATLRYPQFMKGWNYIVKANLTDESDAFDVAGKTYNDWLSYKTELPNDDNLKNAFAKKYQIDEKSIKQIEWLGLFDKKPIYENKTLSSADILQMLLEEKWQMRPMDKDMIIMNHQVEYERKGATIKLSSTLIVKGDNRNYSAMAKTVGLPMGIFAKRLLMGENYKGIRGVIIPTRPEIYTPILKELNKYNIEFFETVE